MQGLVLTAGGSWGGGSGKECWGTQGTPQCRVVRVMWVLGDSGLCSYFYVEMYLNLDPHATQSQ